MDGGELVDSTEVPCAAQYQALRHWGLVPIPPGTMLPQDPNSSSTK